MASAYKCDLSGKLCEGNGIKVLEVVVSPDCRIRITALGKTSPHGWGQGTICPENADKIKRSVLTACGVDPDAKPKPEAKPKPAAKPKQD